MKKTILLVDDEAIILYSLRQELRSALGTDYRYEIALSAEEGLSLFDTVKAEGDAIALVVSDWLMPGMKGDEFLVLVREKNPGVATVLVSGQTDEDALLRLRSTGALAAFFGKPWDTLQLAETCRRLLNE